MTPAQALQAALSGEHAAVYVYGVLAAQTSRSAEPVLFGLLDAAHSSHRTQRDRLIDLIGRLGATPHASAVSYDLPNDAATPAKVRAAAQVTEQRCVDLYGQSVEHTVGAQRAWAIAALSAGAVRLVDLGAAADQFPGLSE